MAAVWSVDLPAVPATYTAVVDGTGHGDPSAPGGYSDYGSIGSYTVTLSEGLVAPPTTTPTTTPTATPTGPPTTPTGPTAPSPTAATPSTTGTAGSGAAGARIDFVTTRLPQARVGRRYRAEIRFTGPVSEARIDWRLPQGLRWRAAGDRILITGTVTRRTTSRFTAELSGDQGSARMTFRLVAR